MRAGGRRARVRRGGVAEAVDRCGREWGRARVTIHLPPRLNGRPRRALRAPRRGGGDPQPDSRRQRFSTHAALFQIRPLDRLTAI